MRPYRRIAATLPLHDLKNHSNVCYPHGTFALASIHRGFCTITGLTSLLRPMVGSTPSNDFVLYAHCTSLHTHTRMTRMRLATIYLGNLGLACNFETYRYSLPPAHMPLLFLVYIQFLLHFGLGHHHLMKSTITASASSPIYNSFYISLDSFFSPSLYLSIGRSV